MSQERTNGDQRPSPIRIGKQGLSYRMATHSSFTASMIKRLGQVQFEVDGESHEPLKSLTTRKVSDPALAMIDAWAAVGDVLTFYQERIANEGYLSTATERRSILELGRLVGYQPRPGVAASVQLAFSLEEGSGEITIPAGTGVKSVAGQGEKAQTFETKHDIIARPEWNEIKPRQFKPQEINLENVASLEHLYIQGASANLRPNDYLVFDFGSDSTLRHRKVSGVEIDNGRDVTKVLFQTEPFSSKALVEDVTASIFIFGQNASHVFDGLEMPNEVAPIIQSIVSLDDKLPNKPLASLISVSNGIEKNDSGLEEWLEKNKDVKMQGVSYFEKVDKTLEEIGAITRNVSQKIRDSIKTFKLVPAFFETAALVEEVAKTRKGFEELDPDMPAVSPMTLVETFQKAVDKVIKGFKPSTDTHLKKLKKLLSDALKKYIDATSPPSRQNFRDQIIDLHDRTIEFYEHLRSSKISAQEDSPAKVLFLAARESNSLLQKIAGTKGLEGLHKTIENSKLFVVQKNLATEMKAALAPLDVPAADEKIVPKKLAVESKKELDQIKGVDSDTDNGAEFLNEALGFLDQGFVEEAKSYRKSYAKLNTDYSNAQQSFLKTRKKYRDAFRDRLLDVINRFDELLSQFDANGQKARDRLIALKQDVDVAKSLSIETTSKKVDLITSDNDGQLRKLRDEAEMPKLFAAINLLIGVLEGLVKNVKTPPKVPTTASTIAGGALENVVGSGKSNKSSPVSNLDPSSVFNASAENTPDIYGKILGVINPNDNSLYERWKNLPPKKLTTTVYALRKRISLFGYNAARIPEFEGDKLKDMSTWTKEWPFAADEEEADTVFLDGEHNTVVPGSYLIIDKKGKEPLVYRINQAQATTRTAYGVSAKTTRLEVQPPWRDGDETEIALLRTTIAYVESESIKLALEPIASELETNLDENNEIELDGFLDGLTSGQKLIITGKVPARFDVVESEVATILGAQQRWLERPGEKPHTVLFLSKGLAHSYDRTSAKIYANTATATHGETRREVIGSGDASKSSQQFALSAGPMTFVGAPTASGSQSSLSVAVNGIHWHEKQTMVEVKPSERAFVSSIDNEQVTSVFFGDGKNGARLPTGTENVVAEYRTGIGKSGNVKKEQISQLATRPLGVKGVVNPLPASGGADPETRDQARRNLPLALVAFDRLVSIQDYEYFARSFAGIGKASSRLLHDGERQIVHVTLAGIDDTPIDVNSELIKSLKKSLVKFGDPSRTVQLAAREHLLLAVGALIKTLPDYEWEPVEQTVRNKLLFDFGFENRGFGQGIYHSELVKTIQDIEGVAHVELDLFQAVDGALLSKDLSLEIKPNIPANLAGEKWLKVNKDQSVESVAGLFASKTDPKTIQRLNKNLPKESSGKFPRNRSIKLSNTWPAQIIYLSPQVPETLLLREIT